MIIPKLLPNRRLIVYTHDIFMAAVSFVLTLLLRMGDSIYSLPLDFIVFGTAIFTVIAAAAFWFMGLYRGIWRYASMNDVIQITKAVTVAVLVFLPVMFLWTPRRIPAAVVSLHQLVCPDRVAQAGRALRFACSRIGASN